MNNYLNNQVFLNLLDRVPIRNTFIRLTLLDFQERPIREIAGAASGNGNLNLNGSSTTRRTISFNMIADRENNNLTDIDNLISINKKFQVSVGLTNPLADYKHYGEIIWFPLGMYIISKASLAWSTSSCTISISAKDKMCMLDGSVSGTMPTTVVLHEIYEYNEDGSTTINNPVLREIITELVHHYGGEPYENIIISDLDDNIKKLVKYVGDTPMWIQNDELSQERNIRFDESELVEGVEWKKFEYGDDVGYTKTPFSFPGELILSAGEAITAGLTKIVNILGNFEYFYNLEGKFIFQRIPNYQDVSYTEIFEDKTTNTNYVRDFSNSKYSYSFTDMETVVSINNNPNYENLKNDFIVWGQKPLTGDATKAICYRVTIDEKPKLDKCKKYMFKAVINNQTYYRYLDSLPEGDFQTEEQFGEISYIDENGKVAYKGELGIIGVKYGLEFEIDNEYIFFELIGVPCEEWREELYRSALEAAATGTKASIYDTELLAYWRENYDTSPIVSYQYYKDFGSNLTKEVAKSKISFPKYTSDEKKWEETNQLFGEDKISTQWFPNRFSHDFFWKFDKTNNPENVTYWMDFIDSGTSLGKYSVNNIGCRTKVTNSDSVRALINAEIPDIIYEENPKDIEVMKKKIQEFNLDSQKYCFLTEEQFLNLVTSATGSSAYDMIRELLYQNLIYNTQITLTSTPKYYLEPNTLIYIKDTQSSIIGDFVIKSISLPLGYNGTMNITASEALVRV